MSGHSTRPSKSSAGPGGFDLVVMAASAGGVTALGSVLAGLPPDFAAAIAIVQHLDPHHPSLMVEILSRRTPLKVREAQEGDRIERGQIFIAPPNRHLLINSDGTLSLSQSELVHFLRPSADLLFESAAASYRERLIGVVLTGTGRDGAFGVKAIKEMGGTVIVQEAETAEFSGMPLAARETGACDRVLRLEKIAEALVELVMSAARASSGVQAGEEAGE